jgi:hypothetical protein
MNFEVYFKGIYWTTILNCGCEQDAIDYCIKTFGGDENEWSAKFAG